MIKYIMFFLLIFTCSEANAQRFRLFQPKQTTHTQSYNQNAKPKKKKSITVPNKDIKKEQLNYSLLPEVPKNNYQLL
jgi:hypothetical protein